MHYMPQKLVHLNQVQILANINLEISSRVSTRNPSSQLGRMVAPIPVYLVATVKTLGMSWGIVLG